MVDDQQTAQSLLEHYRVLDLTDEKGFLCGKILGDLGADVLKIERPGGDPSRNIGPFYQDEPHPEKSLYWFAFNNNKRGLTLDIEDSSGQEIFKRLVKAADFVIESFPPGYMKNLGLDYSILSNINPGIIMVSITPFGQDGPYSTYKGPDIVSWAMSGMMNLCGEIDRPPVRISFPQTYLHAATHAATGAMIALYWREVSGEGQYVDVSIREAATIALMNSFSFWDLNKVSLRRAGVFRIGLSSNAPQRVSWPCRDGYVGFTIFGGSLGASTNQALTEWMDSEGMAPDYLKRDWTTFDLASIAAEELEQIMKPIGEFFKCHTKAELWEGARKRGMQFYPVNDIEDIVEDPQLQSRDFWVQVEHPELDTTITYPGPFIKLSETPCHIWRRAPLIGEHNVEIYQGELGLSQGELSVLKQKCII